MRKKGPGRSHQPKSPKERLAKTVTKDSEWSEAKMDERQKARIRILGEDRESKTREERRRLAEAYDIIERAYREGIS